MLFNTCPRSFIFLQIIREITTSQAAPQIESTSASVSGELEGEVDNDALLFCEEQSYSTVSTFWFVNFVNYENILTRSRRRDRDNFYLFTKNLFDFIQYLHHTRETLFYCDCTSRGGGRVHSLLRVYVYMCRPYRWGFGPKIPPWIVAHEFPKLIAQNILKCKLCWCFYNFWKASD